jgi:hypothetical protein
VTVEDDGTHKLAEPIVLLVDNSPVEARLSVLLPPRHPAADKRGHFEAFTDLTTQIA